LKGGEDVNRFHPLFTSKSVRGEEGRLLKAIELLQFLTECVALHNLGDSMP